ncbi:redoxin domain-containing protein [Myxococcota bacterium]|nr:redoxin domain-containing protein [Myxococcota bacterium]
MLRRVRSIALLTALTLLLLGGCDDSETAGAEESTTVPIAAVAADPAPPPRAAPPPQVKRQERPLPAFEGVTLDGAPFSVSDLLGKRALLFFFDPDASEAGSAAEAVRRIAGLRAGHNFDVLGIALSATSERARAFAKEHDLDFRILDDPTAAIAGRIGLRAPVALIGTDAEGYVTSASFAPPPDVADATAILESQLREALRLPATQTSLEPTLGVRPEAPGFRAERLEGGEPFDLAALRGQPVVLIFFLYTCPHCHHALEFLKSELPKIPEDQRPRLIGVSVGGSPTAVSDALRAEGLDFFPVLLDLDGALRSAYGVFAGVPEIFVIDATGAIVSRIQGWRDDRDPALLRMRLARISGQPVPMLLHSTGYSGSETCGICHEQEHETWLLSSHAHAFDTLVRHGADANPECVSCHVVGFGNPGGYTISPRTPDLENVGCENCHGRGGPHLSPGFVAASNYEPVCATCHDQKHSLGFEIASFLPKVSHAANAELASLPLEKRRALLAERAGPRSGLLPTNARYVGSDACRSCHEQEFTTWAASPHGNSLASLEAKGEAGNAACQRCHVTALGLPGGFPSPSSGAAATPAEHPDLARVGCESCHGPGGSHIGEGAPRIGTIVSLGDKCDSCVILQICGTCHDSDNDPGFEFAVQEKIERQKHGTIEASATRGAGSAALPNRREPGLYVALERGFALLDRRD